MMNFIKVASALTSLAQSVVLVRSALMNYPTDRFGNTVIPAASVKRLLATLRSNAVALDQAAIVVDGEIEVLNATAHR